MTTLLTLWLIATVVLIAGLIHLEIRNRHFRQQIIEAWENGALDPAYLRKMAGIPEPIKIEAPTARVGSSTQGLLVPERDPTSVTFGVPADSNVIMKF